MSCFKAYGSVASSAVPAPRSCHHGPLLNSLIFPDDTVPRKRSAPPLTPDPRQSGPPRVCAPATGSFHSAHWVEAGVGTACLISLNLHNGLRKSRSDGRPDSGKPSSEPKVTQLQPGPDPGDPHPRHSPAPGGPEFCRFQAPSPPPVSGITACSSCRFMRIAT